MSIPTSAQGIPRIPMKIGNASSAFPDGSPSNVRAANTKINPTAHPTISPRVPHFAIGLAIVGLGGGDSFSLNQRSTAFHPGRCVMSGWSLMPSF